MPTTTIENTLYLQRVWDAAQEKNPRIGDITRQMVRWKFPTKVNGHDNRYGEIMEFHDNLLEELKAAEVGDADRKILAWDRTLDAINLAARGR